MVKSQHRASSLRAEGPTAFGVLWIGSLLSSLGSGISSFALATWVFQQSGSVARYSVLSLVASLPSLLVFPIAGWIADRVNRKTVLMTSTAVSAIAMLAAAYLAQHDVLTLGHVVVVTALNAVGAAFYVPAFTASITLLVPKEQIGRANGMSQFGLGLAQVASPALGGWLLTRASLSAILAVDAATFVLLLTALAACHVPMPEAKRDAPNERGFAGLAFGLRFIARRPGLLGLLIYFAAFNFALSWGVILLAPLVLKRASAEALGVILSIAGIGVMVGSLAMVAWRGPRNRPVFILACGGLVGVTLALAGAASSVVVLGVAAFAAMVLTPATNAASQTVWQTKVPPELQGRVFAARTALGTCTVPLAYALSGPLADRVFEPMFRRGGALAGALGGAFGVGDGRGMGAMIFLGGVALVLCTLVAYSWGRIRRLEEEIGDVPRQSTMNVGIIVAPPSVKFRSDEVESRTSMPSG
jgi:MFS family permease